MRIVKLGIISLVVFGLMIYFFSLLIPSHVRISRAVNIVLPKDSIAAYLSDLRTWQQWNVMVTDQDSSKGVFEKSLYKGHKMSVTLAGSTKDSVKTIWRYGKSDEIASGFNLVQSLSDTTVAQWYFDFHLKWYPWEKFGSIVFDEQLGPSMEKSLNNLKCKLENCSQ